MVRSLRLPTRSFSLTTFGTLTLSSEVVPGLAQQRRRLALLALLAASGERGLTRDQILGLLWPETESTNARHSLEQLVHATRRALGDTVFNGVNPLSLNTDVVVCDVVEFERAVSSADLTRAVALYQGPFLKGFFLDDAPEFERWTQSERTRLADRHAAALRQLAAAAETSGDHAAAIGWWRRLADVDPLSSRSALGLMRAFVAAGDRAAALQHGRVYEALVRQELESLPDPSVVSYVEAVRSGRVESVPPMSENAGLLARPLDASRHASAPTPAPRTSAAVRPPVPAAFLPPMWAAGIVGIIVLLSVAWLGWHRFAAPAVDPNRIVVLPFAVTGGNDSARVIGAQVVDLLSPMLTGEGGPIAVDSRTAAAAWNRVSRGRDATVDLARNAARDVGAAESLTGTAVLASGRLTLTGSLVDSRLGDAQPLESVTGSADSVASLLGQMVAQIVVRHANVPPRARDALVHESLPALRAYLDGLRAYRESRAAAAMEAFERALDSDSTFALAALQLATATTKFFRQRGVCVNNICPWRGILLGVEDARSPQDDERFERGVRLAWESRGRLPPSLLPLLKALRPTSNRAVRASELNAALERAAAAAPDRADIPYFLGLVMLYQGPAIGFTDALGRAEALFLKAGSLDSSYLPPLGRLVDVAAYQTDTAKLRRYGAAYLSRDRTSATADFVRWRVAIGVGDTAAERAVASRFDEMDPATLRQIVRASLMTGVALNDADRAMGAIVRRTTDPLERSGVLFQASSLALNRGRPRVSDSLLRLRHELDSVQSGFWQSTTLAALFGDGERATAEASAREREQWLARDTIRWAARPADSIPPNVVTQVWQEAMWEWSRGDNRETVALSSWVRRHGWAEVADILDMLSATSLRRSDAPALRAHADSVARRGCCRPPHQIDMMLASAYELAGDDSAALAVLRRGRWIAAPEFLAAHLLREGRLAEKLGDTTSAIAAYTHFLALYADPEPRLRPKRDSIRAHLLRLNHGRPPS